MLDGELSLVLVVVVSFPGEDSVNLGSISRLNSLLDLLTSLFKSSLHQLLAVEFNLSHVAIHVLNLVVFEPFSVGGDLEESALVPLSFNFKVIESGLAQVEVAAISSMKCWLNLA